MKKYLPIALLMTVLAGVPAGAQNGFNVPFSQFGIGENQYPFDMPYAFSMGGTVYSRSSRNCINPFNPASYAAVELESFVFDMGFNIQTSVLRKDASSLADAAGNVGYLAIAFPLTRWWKVSAGIMPYSKVNYESVSTANDLVSGSDVTTRYDGNGGVSQLYFGSGFNITKQLSVGFNIDYLYGFIQRSITYDFQGNDTTYMMNSRRQKNTTVSNLLFDLGVQYRQPLGEKYTLNMGLTCRVPRKMTVRDTSLKYTYVGVSTGEYFIDTVFPAQGSDASYLSDLEQPLTVGVGLALERNERWQVAADVTYAPWSGLKYTENQQYNILGRSALGYAANYRMSLGAEWMGNPNASSYWGRIGVRAGVYYNIGKLTLEMPSATRLDEKGCGLGVALPMRKGRSVLNLSLGYSSYGNLDLLRRDCLTIAISVGSCERWFMKRKYN